MAVTAALPTLYEYYAPGGIINSGLSVDKPEFQLNGKDIRIYSGAMHYFRIPRKYWRDRLRKLRAAGLNTVETYVPWNLHEPESGKFDFGQGGTDMESFLDLQEYLKIAQEEDLFAIVRPGPFICAEWEWGGLPSWLLRDEDVDVRTSEPKYMNYVKNYFSFLLPILAALQFMNGGPIIAFQVENEYGSAPRVDLDYVQQLHDYMREQGIVELLVTSDGAGNRQRGTLPEILFQTINFGSDPNGNLNILKEMQPGKPFMVMEFWTGWFDHWSESHHITTNSTFRSLYEDILKYPASVSMYMFHGGTNFGFLNGANLGGGSVDNNEYFQPTTTSYDYDAPLNEAGDYTDKYGIVRELIEKYNPVKTLTPDPPELVPRVAYDPIPIEGQFNFKEFHDMLPVIVWSSSSTPIAMEDLPINDDNGQSYGYLIYEKGPLDIKANATLEIGDHVKDTVMILIDGELISPPLTNSRDLNGFGYYRLANSTITLANADLYNVTLSIMVENWGRVNFGEIYHQKKGLTASNTLLLDGEKISGSWIMYPVEFKRNWNSNVKIYGWENVTELVGPALYKATLTIHDEPKDTYINMEGWTKGIVIVNGFVLGRYVLIGPQKSLYLPSQFLTYGDNEIIVFEQFAPGKEIQFTTDLLFY